MYRQNNLLQHICNEHPLSSSEYISARFPLFCKLILEGNLRSENGEEKEMFDWEIRISDFEIEREIRKPLKADFASEKSVLMEDFN